jgi:hypothetical protein
MTETTTETAPKKPPKRTTAAKKKRATAKKAAAKAKAEADRAAKREAFRQGKDEEEGGEGLPRVKGPDVDRSMDDEDGNMYMSMEDLYRLLHLQSEFHRTQGVIKLCQKDLQNAELEYLRKQLEVSKRVGAAQVAHAKAGGDLRRLHEAIELAYGVKMSQITFDDETGMIRSRNDG